MLLLHVQLIILTELGFHLHGPVLSGMINGWDSIVIQFDHSLYHTYYVVYFKTLMYLINPAAVFVDAADPWNIGEDMTCSCAVIKV